MATSNPEDVFRFTSLRAPKSPNKDKWYLSYAKDNYTENPSFTLVDRNISDKDVSPIGGKIFEEVYCNKAKSNDTIVNELLELKPFGYKFKFECDSIPHKLESKLSKYGLHGNNSYIFHASVNNTQYTYYLKHSLLFSAIIQTCKRIIESHLKTFKKDILICQLEKTFNVSTLFNFVTGSELISPKGSNIKLTFQNIKGQLFDILYFLYVSKRKFPINLDTIIDQIRTLHVIEFLGYDTFTKVNISYPSNSINIPKTAIKEESEMPQSKKTLKSLAGDPRKTQPNEIKGEEIIKDRDINQFNTSGILAHYPYISDQNDLLKFYSVDPVIHSIFAKLSHFHTPFNDIRPIGVCDLKIVKQILIKYEAGEIAHIENILKGESKERTHRKLETIENFISDDTINENESSKENQSAERNEMQKEAQKTINETSNTNVNASISYKGFVDASLSTGFSWDKSKEESTRNAQNFAREITQISVERILQRTQSIRTTRRTSETEETNVHKLDNARKDKNVVGIYRYINKRYKAQVFNYGERLMFEFLIPEPAEFYRKSIENKNRFEKDKFYCSLKKIKTLKENGITSKDQFSQFWVDYYAKLLNISFDKFPYEKEIDTTPKVMYLHAGGLNHWAPNEHSWIYKQNQINKLKNSINASPKRDEIIHELSISPQLYSAFAQESITLFIPQPNSKINIKANIFSSGHKAHENNPIEQSTVYLSIEEIPQYNIAEKINLIYDAQLINHNIPTFKNNLLTNLTFKANCSYCQFYVIVITIQESEDTKVINDWKDKIFKEINLRVKEYNDDIDEQCNVEQIEFEKGQKLEEIESIVKIKGRNPNVNKLIIEEELHKHALSLFSKEFDTDVKSDFLKENPIEYQSVPKIKRVSRVMDSKCVIDDSEVDCQIHPITNLESAKKKGKFVQFFEQAFEWDKISYLLYPYFYADKSRWMDNYDHIDNEPKDPVFVAFLRAGYARVLAPVRNTHREAVMHFLYTREPWNGGSIPVIGDEMYIPIYEELRNQTDEYHSAVPEGDSWEYVLPTSLVMLENGSELPVFDQNFPKK